MIRRYNYVIGNSQNDSKQNWSQDKYTPPKISIFPDWPTVQFLGEKFSKPVFMFQNNLSFKVIMFGPPGLSHFEAKNAILQNLEVPLYILMTVYIYIYIYIHIYIYIYTCTHTYMEVYDVCGQNIQFYVYIIYVRMYNICMQYICNDV